MARAPPQTPVGHLRRPRTSVGDVTAKIDHSARWFIERFARDVGLTSKVFSRVQRLQSALRYVHGHASVDLADLAASSGYLRARSSVGWS